MNHQGTFLEINDTECAKSDFTFEVEGFAVLCDRGSLWKVNTAKACFDVAFDNPVFRNVEHQLTKSDLDIHLSTVALDDGIVKIDVKLAKSDLSLGIMKIRVIDVVTARAKGSGQVVVICALYKGVIISFFVPVSARRGKNHGKSDEKEPTNKNENRQ